MRRLFLIAFVTFSASFLLPSLRGAGKPEAGITARMNTPDNSVYTGTTRLDRDGFPSALYNLSSPPFNGTAENAARQYLENHRVMLGVESSTLLTESVIQIPGGAHVRFLQHVNGVPVYRGDLVVSLNESNQVGMIINNFKRGLSPASTVPSFGTSAAFEIAREKLAVTGNTIGKKDSAALMIYRSANDHTHLVYRVLMTNDNPYGDWEVFIDAHSGDLVHAEDMFVQHHESSLVQGRAFVYMPDPLSSARQMYGTTGFTDNNDADSDSLTRYRVAVDLDSITYEGGLYKLKGPFCTVTDIEPPVDPIYYTASSPEGFMYTRSEQAFEAVNVYYHVSTSFRYLMSLGFSVPSLRQIRLDPHGYNGQDNSHFSPSGNWIAWGEGGVDDAEDADVVLHEYGHAIQYNINPNWGGGESGALGEGFGDYWAASYSRATSQWATNSYHYNWVFNWDGHNPFWAGRILNDSRVYPFGGLPIHSAGQIWSAALMGIWNDLGREITDRLVIKSLYYLGSGATARDNAHAILQADRDLYGGAHMSVLLYWLGTVKRFVNPQDYTLRIEHTPLGNSTNLNGFFAINARITAARGVVTNSARVVWGWNGHFSDSLILQRSAAAEYNGLIPAPGVQATCRYYLIVTDSFGLTATSPPGAPAAYHEFHVSDSTLSSVLQTELQPERFGLEQNFPNPFNPSTMIQFSLPERSIVTVKIYNTAGEEVTILVDEMLPAGVFSTRWDGRDLAGAAVSSGIYLYRLEAAGQSGIHREVRKMTLVK